jgi:uncharacterized membrane protein
MYSMLSRRIAVKSGAEDGTLLDGRFSMRKAYIFVPLLGGLLLASCGDDETEPNPTLAITVGEAVTIVQGQSSSTTITVTRGGGYDDEVDLTVSNLPTGVTATLDPQQIPAGSGAGTSTLTLTADATATTGTAQFTIQAAATTRAGLVANTTGSVTVNEAPGFSLAVDPATLELAAGGTATSNVAITRTGGFADAVNLTVENLPTGVTAAFDNAAPTGDAAVLTLTADAAAAAGTSTITVSGAGTPGTKTADIALTITAVSNDFTLALDPAALTVAAGSNGTSTVNITRTGAFTGAVALTATGAPDGVTVAFDPASADAATSTATVTVASTVAVGDIPIVVHGNAAGQAEQTATLTLTVAAPANDFTLALDPAALTVAAGSSGTSAVNITRTGTFTGAVALTATGAPDGVTVAFNPASADGATSTATVTVASTVVAGDYPIVVHGNANGQVEQTGTLTLTVGGTAASDFTIAVDPATLSVAAGASGTAAVNITRTGTFTGAVALTATGAPEGVTVAFDPASADGATSTATITVASTVVAGNYPIEIHGTASGQTTQSVTLTLTVTTTSASATLLDRMTLSVGGYRLALAVVESRP